MFDLKPTATSEVDPDAALQIAIDPDAAPATPAAPAVPSTAGKTPEQILKKKRVDDLEVESLQPYIDYGPNYYVQSMCVATIISFALACWIASKGRGVNRTVALALIVSVPFCMGLYGSVGTLMNMFYVLALAGVTPDPLSIVGGLANVLENIRLGIYMTIPAFAVVWGILIFGRRRSHVVE